MFADSVLQGGVPLPRLGPLRIEAGRVAASVQTRVGLEKATLVYTTDTGPWKDREWKTSSAAIGGGTAAGGLGWGTVSALLPRAERLVFYLNVTDSRGMTVSTPHEEIPKAGATRR